VAEKATVPTLKWIDRMSPQEFAARGKLAWRDRKMCDRCKVRARSEVREINGKVEVLCRGCTPMWAPSANRSPEEQERIDRHKGLMKRRLRLAMLGAF
jgi:hypothetical protein